MGGSQGTAFTRITRICADGTETSNLELRTLNRMKWTAEVQQEQTETERGTLTADLTDSTDGKFNGCKLSQWMQVLTPAGMKRSRIVPSPCRPIKLLRSSRQKNGRGWQLVRDQCTTHTMG
jgi:hypothetical protein